MKLLINYYLTLPFFVRRVIYKLGYYVISVFNKNRIISICKRESNEDIREIGHFLQNNSFGSTVLNLFTLEYPEKDIEVFREDGVPYVLHMGKKLFFKRKWCDDEVRRAYNELRKEQDIRSAHCYFREGRGVEQGDIVADLGAAEGIFSLHLIERARKIYLFECDSEWKEPLEKTFAPWKEKVEIVQKYVGGENSAEMVTLDSFFEKREVSVIKADIEGAEEGMLAGGKNVFCNKVKTAFVCLYHKVESECNIVSALSQYGFLTEINPGYLFIVDSFVLGRSNIRRGVCYARKQ